MLLNILIYMFKINKCDLFYFKCVFNLGIFQYNKFYTIIIIIIIIIYMLRKM